MSEIDRIRQALWGVFSELHSGTLDEDEAEAMISTLDSLADLLRIEHEAVFIESLKADGQRGRDQRFPGLANALRGRGPS